MIALEDVDGVTCLGFGRMAMGEPAYGCATPQGIMRLLAHTTLAWKPARCCRRPQPHSRQAHGHDDAGGQRHGDYLPLAHAKFRKRFVKLMSLLARLVDPNSSR